MNVAVPMLYGNIHGGYQLTQHDWSSRIPDQVSLVNDSLCWLFGALEAHEEIGTGLPDGGHKYFLAQLKAADLDWALFEGDGGNHLYYRPSKFTAVSRVNRKFQVGRSYTDFVVRENSSAFEFHVVLAHFYADDPRDRSRNTKRKAQGVELAKYCAKLGFCVVMADMNSSTEAEGYPRDSMEDAGFLGLRQRGPVSNGTVSTRNVPAAASKSYWIDEIWTRPAQAVSGSALVLVGSASDHNWLKTTVTWVTTDAPTPPPVLAPFVPPPPYSGNPWSATVRTADFALLDPVRFTTATLVENFNSPDMLTITGTWTDLAPALSPGTGLLLHDDTGAQRFSGHLVDLDRQGTKTATLIYASDLVRLWWRLCWANPAGAWSAAGQNRASDNVTGPAETRLLSYVNRNTGPGALAERVEPLLRLPVSQGRGPVSTSSPAYPDVLGDVAGRLAEAANLRLQVVQTYDGWTPHLDLTLTPTPDVSDWVMFSTPEDGGTYLLDPSWRYRLALPAVNVALSAAGGEGAERILTKAEDQDSQDLWQARIEGPLDQTSTTDTVEIDAGLKEALAAGAGPTEMSLPIGRAPGLGTTIPVGARVAASVDGNVIVDRVRQVTTTLTREQGQPTLAVTGTIGSPDGIQSPTQRRLAAALELAKKGQRL